MSDNELKPCPFCGEQPHREWHAYQGGTVEIVCVNPKCPMLEVDTGIGLLKPDSAEKAWNTRPIEDALCARIAELEAELGKADNELEYYREAGRFHPRALKLMRKRKNFVVVAVDEPYFGAVYWMIRGHEMAKGTWTPDDEKAFQAAMVENTNKGGAS